MHQISLVVFDMAGTTVDHGCQAPVRAFVHAFAQMGVEITVPQARGPMGLHKRDHIRQLFQIESVAEQWKQAQGNAWTEDDVQALFERFVPKQAELALEHTDVIPGLLDCLQELREQEIKIATTTGYPRSVTQPILDSISTAGFTPDFTMCADEVPAGRPAPWMIYRCLEALEVFPPQRVVKVGDTVPDIQAARNAGVWAVGVTETGSELGLTGEQLGALESAELEEAHTRVADKLTIAGAHEVIPSIRELPRLLRETWSS